MFYVYTIESSTILNQRFGLQAGIDIVELGNMHNLYVMVVAYQNSELSLRRLNGTEGSVRHGKCSTGKLFDKFGNR